jgi:hypothetical protein
MSASLPEMLDKVYVSMDGSQDAMRYSERHGVKSAAILTIYDDGMADAIASHLAPRIEGRVVVEVGGGIGLLAFHMAQYARRVFCIEANPMWSWTHAVVLLKRKPKNVSYLFGAADEFAGLIHGDVALFCTHSDTDGMRRESERFAREVIDVYGEIVEPHWNELRKLTR